MNMKKVIKLAGMAFCAGLFCACAAQAPDTPDQPDVQDINPGERSVIQTPAPQKSTPDTVREKTI